MLDFVSTNGNAGGHVANVLMTNGGLTSGKLRPYLDMKTGKSYITVFMGGNPKDAKNYKMKEVQTNATLRRDEWRELDDVVTRVMKERLVGIADLESRGLIYNLGNGMGTTVLTSERMKNDIEASVSMDAKTRGQNNRPDYDQIHLPIPIVHVDYELNARVLEASRNMGNALDTENAAEAARAIADTLENMLFTNKTYAFGGGTIYSYLNHPDINLETLEKVWDHSTKTGEEILKDVINMKKKLVAAKHYGPYMLYIPTEYDIILDKDFSDVKGQNTIRQRLLEISNLAEIKVADRLPANNVLMVEMQSNVVRLVKGMPLTNVQWGSEGGFVQNYKALTIQVPQVRSDKDGNSGICLLA